MTREEFITKHAGGHYGDIQSMKTRLSDLAGFAYDSLKPKGTKTGAQIEALTGMGNGDSYRIITTGASITAGTITVLVGDVVYYDEANSVWKFFVSGAAINV